MTEDRRVRKYMGPAPVGRPVTYQPEFRAEVLAAVRAAPWSLTAVGVAYGISQKTVAAWVREARLKIPTAAARMREGGRRAGHPGCEKRREKARKLRAKGLTLQQIADACGYRSEASVHYAVKAVS